MQEFQARLWGEPSPPDSITKQDHTAGQQPKPAPKPRRWWPAALAAGLVLLGLGGWYQYRAERAASERQHAQEAALAAARAEAQQQADRAAAAQAAARIAEAARLAEAARVAAAARQAEADRAAALPTVDTATDMVRLPAGTFTMGSPPDEPERESDEGPQGDDHSAARPKSQGEKAYGIYRVSSCGAITDTSTGREWYVGTDRTLSWDEARQWVSTLNTCGGSWRMPTIAEIRTLYDVSQTAGQGYYSGDRYWPAHIHKVFDAIGSGSWVWSNSLVDDQYAWSFNLNQGKPVKYKRSNTKYTTRAFAVR